MAIDQKYGKVSFEFGNVGEDEPVFVIRGRDILGIAALNAYRDIATMHKCPTSLFDSVHDAIDAFAEWPGEKRLPD